jgi:hypothetical protein
MLQTAQAAAHTRRGSGMSYVRPEKIRVTTTTSITLVRMLRKPDIDAPGLKQGYLSGKQVLGQHPLKQQRAALR